MRCAAGGVQLASEGCAAGQRAGGGGSHDGGRCVTRGVRLEGGGCTAGRTGGGRSREGGRCAARGVGLEGGGRAAGQRAAARVDGAGVARVGGVPLEVCGWRAEAAPQVSGPQGVPVKGGSRDSAEGAPAERGGHAAGRSRGGPEVAMATPASPKACPQDAERAMPVTALPPYARESEGHKGEQCADDSLPPKVRSHDTERRTTEGAPTRSRTAGPQATSRAPPKSGSRNTRHHATKDLPLKAKNTQRRAACLPSPRRMEHTIPPPSTSPVPQTE